MANILIFIICFGASIIGAICGIGGGVIIKPCLDLFCDFPVSTISFLSGMTVLSMSTYSVVKGRLSKGGSSVDGKTATPLAIGAAAGGVLGKILFNVIKSASGNPNMVGAIQSVCLAVITVGTLIYTLKKSSIRTRNTQSLAVSSVLGIALGIMSSFLGIGGGPINIVVLHYFYSMETKTARANSLYIIFFSQLANFLFQLIRGTIPEFEIAVLVLMVIGGVLGGIVGGRVNKKISAGTVDKLFIGLMIVIIGISLRNAYFYAI